MDQSMSWMRRAIVYAAARSPRSGSGLLQNAGVDLGRHGVGTVVAESGLPHDPFQVRTRRDSRQIPLGLAAN